MCLYKKENGMKRFFLLILAGLFLTISILGCNALRGVGTDTKNAGGHIENIGK
jgi:predicted small secreted protein